MNAQTPIDVTVDMIIVGAGISGIGMAVHLSRDCPGKSFAILDRRDRIGGTWDLFRYPGIRSDSDMHTLGFSFAPWTHEKSIADGPSILEYLEKIADEHGARVRAANLREDDRPDAPVTGARVSLSFSNFAAVGDAVDPPPDGSAAGAGADHAAAAAKAGLRLG